MRLTRSVLAILTVLAFAGGPARSATFSVRFDKSVRQEPATGRLVVFLSKGLLGIPGDSPADELDEQDPQPRYGIDVSNLQPGTPAIVDDSSTAFPVALSQLPAGWYRAAAVLIVRREHSRWQSDPGNLYSSVIRFEVRPGGPREIPIALDHTVKPQIWPPGQGADLVEIRSRILSDFRGSDVLLHAGVIPPENFDAQRAYPAVYEVPGYGGDHFDALHFARMLMHAAKGSALRTLHENAFWIVLDPESPNGHTLFMNSDNNGPCGDALVRELIPELERRYKLIGQPDARLLRGHSSGGLSTLWLVLAYPQTFGVTWSTSPDPVDFRHFQYGDIYSDKNMYAGAEGEVPSTRFDGKATLTVRQENAMEEVLGPSNSSGQQWDSWQAAFGHRTASGQVAALYDAGTGEINRAEAESYRRFDVDDLLRKDPPTVAAFFRKRVHLLVGDQDNYYLNEAVAALKNDLDRVPVTEKGDDEDGYITVIPGVNHTTIYATAQMAAIPGQMLEYLRRSQSVPPAQPLREGKP